MSEGGGSGADNVMGRPSCGRGNFVGGGLDTKVGRRLLGYWTCGGVV